MKISGIDNGKSFDFGNTSKKGLDIYVNSNHKIGLCYGLKKGGLSIITKSR